LLIALVLLIVQFSFINCFERGIDAESTVLEIYFKASCSRVNEVLKTIRVSSHRNCDKCLPISLLPGNPDNNDLNSHTLCTDIDFDGHKRSLVRIVEVFSGTNETAPLPDGITYILSLRSEFAFKVKGDVTYMFRPHCFVERDVCNRSIAIVSKCDNRVPNIDDDFDREGFLENGQERIYILQSGQVIESCNTTSTCCPYVSTEDNGICKLTRPRRPNEHQEEHHHNDNNHDDNHHNDHNDDHHHKEHHNDHNNDNHHDDHDNDNDDHHHEEHHDHHEHFLVQKEDENKNTPVSEKVESEKQN